MASDGVGKIKTKRSKDAGKPYDRSKTFFERLKSTVSGFLVPSFISESQWKLPDADPDTDAEEEKKRVASTGAEVGRSDGGYAGGPVDGPGLKYDGFQATFDHSVSAEEHSLASRDRPSSSRQPSSSLVLDCSVTVPLSKGQPLASRGASGPSQGASGPSSGYFCSSSKRSAPLPSADEPSPDATGRINPAFKGGAHPMAKDGAPAKKRCVERNNERTAVVNEEEEEGERSEAYEVPAKSSKAAAPVGGKSFVWQTKSNTSSASWSRSSAQKTPAASGKKPGFDLTAFNTTISHSEQGGRDLSMLNTSQGQSPFYRGKTTYGGASSARSKPVGFDPDYQVVSAVQHQARKIKPVANTSAERPLSLTAKLILQGMDKTEQLNNTTTSSFNSTLSDSLLSFTPQTYKRNSQQASSSRLQPKAGPPVRDQMAPTFAMITQNISTYQGQQQPASRRISDMDVDARKSSTNVTATNNPTTSAVPGRKTSDMEVDIRKSSTNVTATYNLPSAAPGTQAPGKMRREQTRTHYSNRTAVGEEETPMAVDLPSIRLPLTNVQPFSTGGFFSSSQNNTKPFTFSEPLAMNTDSAPTDDARQQKSPLFHFCSPIAVDDHRTNGVTTTSQQPPTSAVGTSEAKSSLAFSFNVNAAVKKPQPSSEPPASGGFAPAPVLKKGSVMDLLGKPSNSPAPSPSTLSSATAPPAKPVTAAPGISADKRPLSELFKPSSNKWTCKECYAESDSSLTKCPCCGESAPAAKSAAGPTQAVFGFPAPAVSGFTAPAVSGFPAQAPVPLTSTPIAKPLTELFKTGDTWVCPTCDVRNANCLGECPCCMTVRPGGPKVSSQSNTNSPFGQTGVTSPFGQTGATSPFGQTGAVAMGGAGPTEKNEAPKTSSNLPSLSTLFQKPPGDWVCGTCMVTNKADQLKCCACEEPKPGAMPAPSNGALSTTGPNGGQLDAQGFKSTPGVTFGGTAPAQSVFKAPDSTGVAPGGGFKMTPGMFSSGFGTGFSAPLSSSDKPDSVPVSGGFKPPGGFQPTGFMGFGQAPKSDANGPSTKPETLSFLAPASVAAAKNEGSTVTAGFAGTQNTGFTFGSSSVNPTSSAPAFGSGLRFGEVSSSEKKEESTGMQRPPLRPTEDNNNGNCNIVGNANIGSLAEKNSSAPVNRSESNVVSSTSFLSGATTPLVSSSAPVTSSSALPFGLVKPPLDVLAPKFNFSDSSGGFTAVSLAAFGAPSTSLAVGATKPVFSAPSSITSASVAPPGTSAGAFFAPPVMPANKPSAQEAAKSSLFNFGQKPSDVAVPAVFKFGETQPPAKEEAKPSAPGIFQFGQQPQSAAPTGLFQFGASSNNATPGAGIFNATTSQPPAAAPAFGQASATASGIFSFGAGNSAQPNPGAGVFTFGAKPADGASKPDVTSFSQIGTKRSMEDDAVSTKRGRASSEDMQMQDVEPSQTPKQPSVGFAFNALPTGFGFGAPQGSAPVNNAGFFGAKPANPASGFGNPSNANPASGFGNPSNANPASGFGNPSNAAASAAGAFTFTGQQPSAPAAAFGSQSGSSLANGSANTGFSFGPSAAAPPSFNFAGAPPSFNFAATPAASNPSRPNPFNVPAASGPAPPGRTIKKAVRRSAFRKQ